MNDTKSQSNKKMKFEKNKKGYFRNPYNVIQKLIDGIITEERNEK